MEEFDELCNQVIAASQSRPGSPSIGPEEQCVICWGLLCEPIAWPQCGHQYCLVCAIRVRRKPRPTCPLCRAPAERIRTAADLKVDTSRVAQVRKVVGHSAYESRRRELWTEAARLDDQSDLGELPLFSMGSISFGRGSHFQLRMYEPRYREMARRAMAPGGVRRFAVVMQPAQFEAGAKGRVCDILSSTESANGDWQLVIEGGSPCRILDVATEEVQLGSPPLFHGTLEEVEEDELARSISSEPFVSAAVLNTLSRHLRAMRSRHLLMELLDSSGQRRSAEQDSAPTQENPIADQLAIGSLISHDTQPRPNQEGIGAMLNLLMAYRQLLNQMDQLLAEAARSADRLDSTGTDTFLQDIQHNAEYQQLDAEGPSRSVQHSAVSSSASSQQSTSQQSTPVDRHFSATMPLDALSSRIPSSLDSSMSQRTGTPIQVRQSPNQQTTPTTSPQLTFRQVRQALNRTSNSTNEVPGIPAATSSPTRQWRGQQMSQTVGFSPDTAALGSRTLATGSHDANPYQIRRPRTTPALDGVPTSPEVSILQPQSRASSQLMDYSLPPASPANSSRSRQRRDLSLSSVTPEGLHQYGRSVVPVETISMSNSSVNVQGRSSVPGPVSPSNMMQAQTTPVRSRHGAVFARAARATLPSRRRLL